jgi:hypothetical protein
MSIRLEIFPELFFRIWAKSNENKGVSQTKLVKIENLNSYRINSCIKISFKKLFCNYFKIIKFLSNENFENENIQ